MKRLLIFFIIAVSVLFVPPVGMFRFSVFAEENFSPSADEVREVANGIISWKKQDLGAAENGFLINDALLSVAGSTAGDWFPLGLSRLGVEDNQSGYLAVINDNVQKRYDADGGDKLGKYKSTEWHRISLAILSCGGDPRHAGNKGDIDLIADGVYNRADESGNGLLDKQGINGLIWGLIALDSGGWEVPEGACYTREKIINGILDKKLSDGGWALSGSVSDPDITAMAVQAFAPYCETTGKVRAAVDGALAFLSSVQTADGDYLSWGMQNSESTAQVIIALCSLGINPFTDGRFIKNGNTLWDGLMKYRLSSGGFAHSFINDSDNPTAVAGQPNSMAGEQALCALAAAERLFEGKSALYDMRELAQNGDLSDNPSAAEFTQSDIDEVLALPEDLTTQYRASVLRLYAKINNCADFDGKEGLAAKLGKAKTTIDAILKEVEDIKREIKESLYPFDKVSLRNKKKIYALCDRYYALSDYDKTLFDPTDIEGLEKCKTKVDNLLTAIIVSACVGVAAASIVVCVALGVRKRKRQKAAEKLRESDE